MLAGFRNRCRADERGATAVVFAFALPVALGVCSLAVDYGMLTQRQLQLQNAADSAALAAARELSLANTWGDAITGRAQASVMSQLKNAGAVQITTEVIDKRAVRVALREQQRQFFSAILQTPATKLEVSAVARVASGNLCMLALEPKTAGALSLNSNARLTALDCSVFSNSKDRHGIQAADSAMVDADFVCSSGGISGKHTHFKKLPTTDCPQIYDPLAGREPPYVGSCDFNKTEIKGGIKVLNPGVYCTGLKVTDKASVWLNPGTYIIQGGKLLVDKGGALEGRDVSFYLAGKDSSFEFAYDSVISLEAPRAGPMAGLLVFDDRAGKYDKHKIYSNYARNLLGTIYLPNGALYIDSQRPIADRSAYTVIVARTVELYDGPDLVLNSNYDATSVPVPKGVGPTGSTITLSK